MSKVFLSSDHAYKENNEPGHKAKDNHALITTWYAYRDKNADKWNLMGVHTTMPIKLFPI